MKKLLFILSLAVCASNTYAYYQAQEGRWLSRDPIEERGGVNIYGFINNSGVNKQDTLGLADTGKCNCVEGISVSLNNALLFGEFELRDLGLYGASRAPSEMNSSSGSWYGITADDKRIIVGLHAQIVILTSGDNPEKNSYNQTVQVVKSSSPLSPVDKKPRHDKGGGRMTGKPDNPYFGGFFKSFKQGGVPYVTFVDPTDTGFHSRSKDFHVNRTYVTTAKSADEECKYTKCSVKWSFNVSYSAGAEEPIIEVRAEGGVCE